MTLFFSETKDFWASLDGRRGVRNGPFEGGPPAFMFLISFLFLFVLFFLLEFLSNMFHCWHWYQSLTQDVSSAVGAPWRWGVLTTSGGIARIGWGHILRREHDSTPQSGVEAPRL